METLFVANNNQNGGSDSISVFTVNSAGALTAQGANHSPGTGVTGVSCLAVAGSFLYVGALGGSISGFSIGAGGSLTALAGGSPVATGITPQSLVSGAGGKYLYVLSVDPTGLSPTSTVFVYSVDANTGALTPLTTSYTLNVSLPISIRISPSGTNLYVALGKGQGIQAYTVNNDGSLTRLAATPTSGNFLSAYDLAVVVNNSHLFAYASDNLNGKMVAFVGQADGSLQQMTNGVLAAGINPFGVSADSAGAFVFVANDGGSNISGYRNFTDGTPSAMSSSPFTAGTAPRAVLLGPTGQWVYVANERGSPDISVFSLSNGTLSSLGSAKTGGSAIALAAIKQQ